MRVKSIAGRLRSAARGCFLKGCRLTKAHIRHEFWALVKSAERLKSGAEMSQRLATRSARRVLRPTGFFARLGQGAYIGSGGVHRVRGANSPKVVTSPFEDDDEDEDDRGAHAPLMIPKLAESVGPVAILDPLAGPIAHLLAQV